MQTSISKFFGKKSSQQSATREASSTINLPTVPVIARGSTSLQAHVQVDLTEDVDNSECMARNAKKIKLSQDNQQTASADYKVLVREALDKPFDPHRQIAILNSFADRYRHKQESSDPVKLGKPTFTPLEKQVVEIKERYPDCLLMVQCGYRFRFFGDDAVTAAKVLTIYCHKDHNFMVASVPTYRVLVHLRRLVAAGLKVAVVRQSETAAIHKASRSSSATFQRHVAGVYTAASMLDNADDSAYCDLLASSASSQRSSSDDVNIDANMDSEGEGNGDNDEEVVDGVAEEDHAVMDEGDSSANDASSQIAVVRRCCGEQYLSSAAVAFAIVLIDVRCHSFTFDVCADETEQGAAQCLLDSLDNIRPVEVLSVGEFDGQLKQAIIDRTKQTNSRIGILDRYICRVTELQFSSALEEYLNEGSMKQSATAFSDAIAISAIINKKENKTNLSNKTMTNLLQECNTDWTRDVPPLFIASLVALFEYFCEFNMHELFNSPSVIVQYETINDSDRCHHSSTYNNSSSSSSSSSGSTSSNGGGNGSPRKPKAFILHPITARDLDVFTASIASSSIAVIGPQNYCKPLSLFGLLNQCLSSCGSRCLKRWLNAPLCNCVDIWHRQHAAQWLQEQQQLQPVVSSSSSAATADVSASYCRQFVDRVRALLVRCSEVEGLLTSLHHKKLLPRKLLQLLSFASGLKDIGIVCSRIHAQQAESSLSRSDDSNSDNCNNNNNNNHQKYPLLISRVIEQLARACEIAAQSDELMKCIKANAAAEYTNSATISSVLSEVELSKHETVRNLLEKKLQIHQRFENELMRIRRTLNKSSMTWKSLRNGATSTLEWLIELTLSEAKTNEKMIDREGWKCVSSTKSVQRYHTAEVQTLIADLALCSDEITRQCQLIWTQLVQRVEQQLYQQLRLLCDVLAEVDVLLAFGKISCWPGYIWPTYTNRDSCTQAGAQTEAVAEEGCNECRLEGCRHPVIHHQLSSVGQEFIPNDVIISNQFGHRRCLVVTGPNMGGKSSYVRMVAILALLGQVGCAIPASVAKMCIFDNILTRMGAGDEIAVGRSTLMCELLRTNQILRTATSKSLVVIDELGRGTSTHDGVAVAFSTLKYFIQKVGCSLLFVTHYAQISRGIEEDTELEGQAVNVHMGFVEDNGDVHFLYRAVDGASSGSFGLYVARLAGFSDDVLLLAREKADALLNGTLCISYH